MTSSPLAQSPMVHRRNVRTCERSWAFVPSETSHSGQYDHGHGKLRTPNEHSLSPTEGPRDARIHIENLDMI